MGIIMLHVLRLNYMKPVYNDETTSAFSPTYFITETTQWNCIGCTNVVPVMGDGHMSL
jgi:hypothetical protein